jgi:hypothetical protein
MREKENETYLGDSVAASFDGQMIWLRTTDGNNQRIALEGYVFEAPVKYGTELEARLAREMGESEND